MSLKGYWQRVLKRLGLETAAWGQIPWLPFACLMMISALAYVQGLFDHSLNWDEANTLAIAKLSIPEMFYVSAIRDINLAGGSLVQRAWLCFFPDSDVSIRCLSAVAGLATIAGAYAIVRAIHLSREVAFYAGLMVMASPLLARFVRLSTKHVFYCAEVFWSYALFFRLLESVNASQASVLSSFKRPWIWLYLLISLLAIVTEPIGPVFLLGQGLYGATIWKSLRPAARWVLIGVLGFLALSFLPQIWLFFQDWHAGHMPEMASIHPLIRWQDLWFIPVNLLLWGRDRLFLPNLSTVVLYGFGSAVLLLPAYFCFYRNSRLQFFQVLIIGLVPMLSVLILSIASEKALFQYRALMFGMLSVMLPVAWWITTLRREGKHLWWLLLSLMLLLQWRSWHQMAPKAFAGTDYALMAADVRSHFVSGDGIVLAPGYHHLGFYRYFDPSRFGLTAHERDFDPRRENIHHMVQSIDQDAFLVSGEDFLASKPVLKAFERFEASHRRVWLLVADEYLPILEPYLSCNTINILQGPGGKFWEVRCPFRHPGHCQRPLIRPAVPTRSAGGWVCPKRTKS